MLKMNGQELEAFLYEEFPQIRSMDCKVLHVDAESIEITMQAKEEHLRPGGTVSGPTMMSLVDLAMYLLVLAQIGPVALAVTTNLNINFLRKPEPGDLIVKGRLLKLGKTLASGDFTLHSKGVNGPVAHATSTYAIPPLKPSAN